MLGLPHRLDKGHAPVADRLRRPGEEPGRVVGPMVHGAESA